MKRAEGLLWRVRIDWVALVLVCVVAIVGYLILSNERDNRIEATRDLTCALAEWNGRIVSYFEGAKDRLVIRIGTPAETPTDRLALAQIKGLLAASTKLDADLGGSCGPVIPNVVPPKGER